MENNKNCIRRVYGVKDIKSGYFTHHFESDNDSTAIRTFGDIVNNPRGIVFMHPEDYMFYHLGFFDYEFGRWTNNESPISMAVGSQVVKQPQETVLN